MFQFKDNFSDLFMFQFFKMSLCELTATVHNNESARLFLREKFILRSVPPSCSVCGRNMTEVKDDQRGDGVIDRCPSHKGKTNQLGNNILVDISVWYKVPH
jgi:hypothetical protein